MAQNPVNTGHDVSLSSTPVSPSANLSSHLCCTRVVPLNMNLNVSTGIRFADTQSLVALRMSFNGVTSLIFMPLTLKKWGAYWFRLVRPFVRPSVRSKKNSS